MLSVFTLTNKQELCSIIIKSNPSLGLYIVYPPCKYRSLCKSVCSEKPKNSIGFINTTDHCNVVSTSKPAC